MDTLKSLCWRVCLMYHWRKLGMCKRRLRALPSVWRMTDEPPYRIRYFMGYSPLKTAMEEI